MEPDNMDIDPLVESSSVASAAALPIKYRDRVIKESGGEGRILLRVNDDVLVESLPGEDEDDTYFVEKDDVVETQNLESEPQGKNDDLEIPIKDYSDDESPLDGDE
ncbi:hypothetical protein ACFE04_012218 [Oxalis oulophora]